MNVSDSHSDIVSESHPSLSESCGRVQGVMDRYYGLYSAHGGGVRFLRDEHAAQEMVRDFVGCYDALRPHVDLMKRSHSGDDIFLLKSAVSRLAENVRYYLCTDEIGFQSRFPGVSQHPDYQHLQQGLEPLERFLAFLEQRFVELRGHEPAESRYVTTAQLSGRETELHRILGSVPVLTFPYQNSRTAGFSQAIQEHTRGVRERASALVPFEQEVHMIARVLESRRRHEDLQ